jgi:hypothetical protein
MRMTSLFPVHSLFCLCLVAQTCLTVCTLTADSIRKSPGMVNGCQYTISAFMYTFSQTMGRLARAA